MQDNGIESAVQGIRDADRREQIRIACGRDGCAVKLESRPFVLVSSAKETGHIRL
jgi:hypothetical protein